MGDQRCNLLQAIGPIDHEARLQVDGCRSRKRVVAMAGTYGKQNGQCVERPGDSQGSGCRLFKAAVEIAAVEVKDNPAVRQRDPA